MSGNVYFKITGAWLLIIPIQMLTGTNYIFLRHTGMGTAHNTVFTLFLHYIKLSFTHILYMVEVFTGVRYIKLLQWTYINNSHHWHYAWLGLVSISLCLLEPSLVRWRWTTAVLAPVPNEFSLFKEKDWDYLCLWMSTLYLKGHFSLKYFWNISAL